MAAIPEKLPEAYWDLWQALAGMNRQVGSRQRLASMLRVSTHTIQRILVDGDVPDIGGSASRRQSMAWARTLIRLADGLEMAPLPLLISVGYAADNPLTELVDTELCRLREDEPAQASPADTLAEILLDVLGETPESMTLRRALDGYIQLRRRKRHPRASDEMISRGDYCRSCLAPLDPDDHADGDYCRWCGTEDGDLRPRSQVLEIMTDWFLSWQNGIDRKEARRRAESYMRAMPAWNS